MHICYISYAQKKQSIASPPLSDSSHASRLNREVRLLLIRIRASSSINLVLAIPVGNSTLIRVVRNRLLQLQNVGAGGRVDVSRVALARSLALALDVVFVLKAAGALVLFVGGGEVDIEAVVAACGAAEDEVVDEECAVGLGGGVVAAGVGVAAAGGGGGSGGGEAGGSEGDDGGGTHFCCWRVVGFEVVSGSG